MKHIKTAILASFLVKLLIAQSAYATQFQAIYTVPVDPQLQSVGTFALSHLSFENTQDETVLQYQLPVQLTGYPAQTVTFSGPTHTDGTPLVLTGPNGTASCNAAPGSSASGFTCSMQMAQIQINPTSVSQVLKATSSSPAELNARMQVAAQFGSDPIGIVRYYPIGE